MTVSPPPFNRIKDRENETKDKVLADGKGSATCQCGPEQQPAGEKWTADPPPPADGGKNELPPVVVAPRIPFVPGGTGCVVEQSDFIVVGRQSRSQRLGTTDVVAMQQCGCCRNLTEHGDRRLHRVVWLLKLDVGEAPEWWDAIGAKSEPNLLITVVSGVGGARM